MASQDLWGRGRSVAYGLAHGRSSARGTQNLAVSDAVNVLPGAA